MSSKKIDHLLSRGDQLISSGDFVNAINVFKRAVAITSSSPYPWLGLGQCFKAKGNIAEAKKCYEKSIAIAPTSVRARYLLGELFFEIKQYENAKEQFSVAVKHAPHWYKLLDALARTLLITGNQEEAIDIFNQVVEIAPERSVPWANRGWALMNIGNTSEALKSLKKSLSIDPNCEIALVNLGFIQRAHAKNRQAIETLNKAVTINDGLSSVWLELGKGYDAIDDYKNAASCYEKAIKIESKDIRSLLILGWYNLYRGGFHLAEKVMRKCLELDEYSLAANLGLGHCLAQKGKVSESFQYYSNVFSVENTEIDLDRSPRIDVMANWRHGFVVLSPNLFIPSLYAVFIMTSKLNLIAHREIGISIVDFPLEFLTKYSTVRDNGGKLGIQRAKTFPLAFLQISSYFSDEFLNSRLINLKEFKDPPIFMNLSFFRGLFHENFGHAFDTVISNWIVDRGKQKPKNINYQDFSKSRGSKIGTMLGVAGRVCSEGFALWLQFYCEKELISQIDDKSETIVERRKYAKSHETNPYKIGLEAFELIEKRFGELCALVAYFVSYDIPEIFQANKNTMSDIKESLTKTINNPNYRLIALSKMPKPKNFRHNDAFSFLENSKEYMISVCEKTKTCSIAGR